MSWQEDQLVGWQGDQIIGGRMPGDPPEPEENIFEQGLIGIGSGMNRMAQGTKQLGLDIGDMVGLVDPETAANSRREIEEERAFYDQSPVGQGTAGAVGQFAGEVLPSLLIPGGLAGKLGTRMATGALAGTAIGATSMDNRAQDMMMGAGLGAAGPAMFRGLESSGVVDKLRAFRGAIDDITEDKALSRVAKEHGVDLLNADRGNQWMMNLESSNPGIMQAAREQQQGQLKDATQKIIGDYQQRLGTRPYRTNDMLINEVAVGGPHSNRAAQILEDMSAAGDDDWSRIAQVSGSGQALAHKIEATKRYQRVSELAKPMGSVPATETRHAVHKALNEATEAIVPDNQLIAQLKVLRDNLAEPRNYNAMRMARSDIGDMVSDSMRGVNAVVGQKGTRALQSVKNSLEVDMRKFSEGHGGILADAQKSADDFYKETVVPYKDRGMAKALSGEDPDEVVKSMLKRGSQKHRATRFYNALDGKGQDAIRYGLLDNAYIKSFNVDSGIFSPAKFRREMRANKGVYELAFSGKDREVMEGFLKLLNATKKAGQTGFDPQTGIALGNTLSRAAMAGVGAASGGVGGAALGAIAQPVIKTPIVKWMLTSPRALALVKGAAKGDAVAAWDEIQMLMTRSAIEYAKD